MQRSWGRTDSDMFRDGKEANGTGTTGAKRTRKMSLKSSEGQDLDLRRIVAYGFHAEYDRNLRGFQTDEQCNPTCTSGCWERDYRKQNERRR